MDFKSILLAALIGGVIGVAGSFYIIKEQTKRLTDRVENTPPIVVVDFGNIAASYPKGANQEEIQQLMVNTNNAIVKYKEAGYIVLDARYVLGAPDTNFLPEDLIQ